MQRAEKQADGCLTAILKIFSPSAGRKDLASLLYPYETKNVLTPAERDFYQVLKSVVGEEATIFIKVGLQDIFKITDQSIYTTARNRISTRHLDFLLCDPETFMPIAGIELDDSSHNREDRVRYDEFKDRVFAAAVLPLIRFPVRAKFEAAEIRAVLQSYFGKPETEEPKKIEQEQQPILCPKCGVPMVLKTAGKGAYKGQVFYACPNFPKCREKKPVPVS
jgi:hypothetical protein